MSISKDIMISILSIYLIISVIIIIMYRNNKQNNQQGVITYEITTNNDEKIIDRATDYVIDEMGNLSLKFNNIKIGSYSYGCWTKIVEVENAPKTD